MHSIRKRTARLNGRLVKGCVCLWVGGGVSASGVSASESIGVYTSWVEGDVFLCSGTHTPGHAPAPLPM